MMTTTTDRLLLQTDFFLQTCYRGLPSGWPNKTIKYVQIGISKTVISSKFFIQKLLESATTGTLVTKGVIESNFLTTPTEKPKFNHWVRTTLNLLGVGSTKKNGKLSTFCG